MLFPGPKRQGLRTSLVVLMRGSNGNNAVRRLAACSAGALSDISRLGLFKHINTLGDLKPELPEQCDWCGILIPDLNGDQQRRRRIICGGARTQTSITNRGSLRGPFRR